MFVALWEYEVKPGCEERFKNAYRPAGDWLGCSRATRTTARLVFCAIPFVLRFIAPSISGIRAKPTNSSWPPTKTSTRCWTPRGKN